MYKAIAHNKLNTVLIMSAFVVIIGGISLLVSYLFGDANIAIVSIAIAAVYALIQYFAAGAIAVSMTGAKEIAKKDNPRLYNVVEKLSITTGLPMPKVYMISDPAPNAFATGRDPKHAIVCATTGLLEIMNDEELEAVMAHEMSHVKNYDIRVSMIAFGLASVVGMLSQLAGRAIINGRRGNNNHDVLQVIIGVAVIILAPILALIVQMAISRNREYLADSSSTMITRYPKGMISALQKLKSHSKPMQHQDSATAMLFISNPLKKSFLGSIFSTHPPLEDRIKALEKAQNEF